MKTQISRTSFDPKKHYSGVYQQQGRMITDADWNEQADISKERLRAALDNAVKSGVPQDNGMVDLSVAPPVLKWGIVYADGIQGEIRPDPSQYDGTLPPEIDYLKQEDFPSPPALPDNGNYVFYVDIWERSVVSLEDEGLLDYGLHGADTCSRTQTMAQLKWCLPSMNPETDRVKNPSKGNSRLTIFLSGEGAGPDPCDPCATEVAIDAGTGNYLFRLEVHDVEGPVDHPSQMTIKWSLENGAEIHEVGNEPPGFKQSKWIYEFFDKTAEKHLGVNLAPTEPKPVRGTLETGGYPASVAGLPAFVRRWDGCCEVDMAGETATGTYVGTRMTPQFAGGRLRVLLNKIGFELDLAGRQVVAGDYWLAVVREQAPDERRITLVSDTPVGICHHYVNIATFAAGMIVPFTAREKRKLNFPALTNIAADKVGYDPLIKQDRWKDIHETAGLGTPPAPGTVQDAIDDIIDNFDSSDLFHTLPSCDQNGGNTLMGLMDASIQNKVPEGAATKVKLADLWNALLCHFFATTVPLVLDPEKLASVFVDSGVKTVQDALNLLGRTSGRKTCSVTLGPGCPQSDLPQAFAAYHDQENVTFCLQSGEYTLPAEAVTGKTTVKIVGAGSRASVVRVSRPFSCTAKEVILRDIAFVGNTAAASLAFHGQRIAGEGCRFDRKLSSRTYEWSKVFEAGGNSYGCAVTIDPEDNVIIMGTFSETINLGGKVINSSGSNDFFLAKFDASGKHLWSHGYEGVIFDTGCGLCADSKGNIVVAGIGVQTLGHDGNLFLGKFDREGKKLWAKTYGDAGPGYGICLGIDLKDDIVLGGTFGKDIKLNFGGADLKGNGSANAFLAKITDQGKHAWSLGLKGDHITQIKKIAITRTNEMVIAGTFQGSISDLGPRVLKSRDVGNLFVAKIDETGKALFGKTFKCSGETALTCLAIDKKHQIIVGGAFAGKIELGNDERLVNLHDDQNIFVIATDEDGDYRWAKTFTPSVGSRSHAEAMAVTAENTMVLTGEFDGPIDFGGKQFDSTGSPDLFVAAFDSDGNYVWAQVFAPQGRDAGSTLRDSVSTLVGRPQGFVGAEDLLKKRQGVYAGGSLAANSQGSVLITGALGVSIKRPEVGVSIPPATSSKPFLARLKLPGPADPFVTVDRYQGQTGLSELFFRANEWNVIRIIDGVTEMDHSLSITDNSIGCHILDNVCQGIICFNGKHTRSLSRQIDSIQNHVNITLSDQDAAVFIGDNVISCLQFNVPDGFLKEGILTGNLDVPLILKVTGNLFTEKGNVLAGRDLTVIGNNFQDGEPSESGCVALTLARTCMIAGCEAPAELQIKNIALNSRFAASGNLLEIVHVPAGSA